MCVLGFAAFADLLVFVALVVFFGFGFAAFVVFFTFVPLVLFRGCAAFVAGLAFFRVVDFDVFGAEEAAVAVHIWPFFG